MELSERKIKKKHSEQFVIFCKMEIFSPKLKNSYIFLYKKNCLIFQEGTCKGPPPKILHVRKRNILTPNLKTFLRLSGKKVSTSNFLHQNLLY